jgi:hypothetical protein
MMTSKDQEKTFFLSTDRKYLLTTTHKMIKADSHTCLKTLLQKTKEKTFNEKEIYTVIKPKLISKIVEQSLFGGLGIVPARGVEIV